MSKSDSKGIAIAAEAEESVNIKVFYNTLKDMISSKVSRFNELDFLVRVRHGIKPLHSSNVLLLYFYHLYLTEPEVYEKLKTANNEASMKNILGNKIMTTYQGGQKSTCICSDMFKKDFLELINAYLDYIDGHIRP